MHYKLGKALNGYYNIMKTAEMFKDKRGRPPEEKVKGHSGAIYRGPLMLYINYQCSSRFLQEYFQDLTIELYINQICPQVGPYFILGA